MGASTPTSSSPPPSRFGISRIDPAAALIAAAAVVIALLTWSGLRSGRAAVARQAELARVGADLRVVESLSQRYAPAVAAESLSWRQTWISLRDLGILGDERIATTRMVSRAAEAAGLRNVRVFIGPPDTTGLEARLSTEGIRRRPAPFSLLVEARGGLRPVIAFIGQLPPSVAVSQLSLVRMEGGRRHRIALAVYELEFTNGPPPEISGNTSATDVRSPLESRAPGGGDIRGPDG